MRKYITVIVFFIVCVVFYLLFFKKDGNLVLQIETEKPLNLVFFYRTATGVSYQEKPVGTGKQTVVLNVPPAIQSFQISFGERSGFVRLSGITFNGRLLKDALCQAHKIEDFNSTLGINFTMNNSTQNPYMIFTTTGQCIGESFAEDVKVIYNKSLTGTPKNRVIAFAGYSGEHVIDPSVVYYIKKLKELSDRIIVVMDNPLFPNEVKKIEPYVDGIIAYHHESYDFGSYAKGFFTLKSQGWLDTAEELLLVNDSMIAGDAFNEGVLQAAKHEGTDFFGINIRTNIRAKPYVESYFLGFNKSVFSTDYFSAFFEQIETARQQGKKGKYFYKHELKISDLMLENTVPFSSIFKDVDIYGVVNQALLFQTVGLMKKTIFKYDKNQKKSVFIKGIMDIFQVPFTFCTAQKQLFICRK